MIRLLKNNLFGFIKLGSFDDFIKTVCKANLLLMAIDFLFFVFFDEPINSFFEITDRFADFLKAADSLQITKMWDGPNFYIFNLLTNHIHHVVPPATILFWALAANVVKIGVSRNVVYVVLFVLPFVIIYFLRLKFQNKSSFLYLLFFSYPVLMSIMRGNVATIVFFSLTLFLLYRHKKRLLASFFLILGVSFKITPLIFLVQFYRGQIGKFVQISILIIIGLVGFNASVIYLNNQLVLKEIYNSVDFFEYLKSYNESAIEGHSGLRFGSSIYMPLITAIGLIDFPFYLRFIKFNPYAFNAIVVGLLLIISILKHKMLVIKKLVDDEHARLEFLVVGFILFMPVTADYYLLMLFLPLLFIPFANFSNTKKLCYLFLLLPKEVVGTAFFIGKEIPIGPIVNPILLSIIFLELLQLLDLPSILSRRGN